MDAGVDEAQQSFQCLSVMSIIGSSSTPVELSFGSLSDDLYSSLADYLLTEHRTSNRSEIMHIDYHDLASQSGIFAELCLYD